MSAPRCHQCGEAWESPHRAPGRAETCVKCGADLHCCLNCRFYAPGRPQDCQEPNVERVLDKDRRNYCDYFEFAHTSAGVDAGAAADDARKQFDDLFRS